MAFASALAGLVGIFCAYLSRGYSVSAAFAFAWPIALITGGIGVFVVLGPLLTAWSAWGAYVLNAPSDVNLSVLFVNLPSTIAVAVAAGATWFAKVRGREVRVWRLTLLIAPAAHARFMVVGSRLSAS